MYAFGSLQKTKINAIYGKVVKNGSGHCKNFLLTARHLDFRPARWLIFSKKILFVARKKISYNVLFNKCFCFILPEK
jgi:hypothetical protein